MSDNTPGRGPAPNLPEGEPQITKEDVHHIVAEQLERQSKDCKTLSKETLEKLEKRTVTSLKKVEGTARKCARVIVGIAIAAVLIVCVISYVSWLSIGNILPAQSSNERIAVLVCTTVILLYCLHTLERLLTED